MGNYYYYYNENHPEEAPELEILSELLKSVENEIVEFKAGLDKSLFTIDGYMDIGDLPE